MNSNRIETDILEKLQKAFDLVAQAMTTYKLEHPEQYTSLRYSPTWQKVELELGHEIGVNVAKIKVYTKNLLARGDHHLAYLEPLQNLIKKSQIQIQSFEQAPLIDEAGKQNSDAALATLEELSKELKQFYVEQKTQNGFKL